MLFYVNLLKLALYFICCNFCVVTVFCVEIVSDRFSEVLERVIRRRNYAGDAAKTRDGRNNSR